MCAFAHALRPERLGTYDRHAQTRTVSRVRVPNARRVPERCALSRTGFRAQAVEVACDCLRNLRVRRIFNPYPARMARTLVWDLPTRLFHWIFAFGFAIAAVIALGLGDDSPAFPLHALIGLVLGMAIALRVMWGFVGSRHARFASFAFGPSAVLG